MRKIARGRRRRRCQDRRDRRDRRTNRRLRVDELMATPTGRDEVGTPDDAIRQCDRCGTLYRDGGRHRCTHGWVGGEE